MTIDWKTTFLLNEAMKDQRSLVNSFLYLVAILMRSNLIFNSAVVCTVCYRAISTSWEMFIHKQPLAYFTNSASAFWQREDFVS